ncbi:MAG: DUF3347 domain-containing protein [Flavobacteriia bacterium]|nr:DUF3347 domain-containing protein [Flavobacteriia bacterium]NDH90460.1 DUF3347 domain-containing protein [Flavobacteriia bacterium]
MKYLASLLIAASFLVACSQPEAAEETVTEVQHQNYVKPEYGQTVLQQYLHLKDALVSSNVQEARDAAKLMYMHLDVLKHEAIVKPLVEIIENEDLALQRERFYSLSQALQVALEANDDEVINAGREPLFIQYCPMAFGNQGGTWLSAEPNVLNPFYGDEMLTCGVVRDTL